MHLISSISRALRNERPCKDMAISNGVDIDVATVKQDDALDGIPDEILAAIFEDLVEQWEAAKLNQSSGWSRPLPQSIVSRWRDMPDAWLANWRYETSMAETNTLPHTSWVELFRIQATIMLVSRRWRDVALRSPRLFRNVKHIKCPVSADHPCQPFEMLVDRSGIVPLRVFTTRAIEFGTDEGLRHLAASNSLGRLSHLYVNVSYGFLDDAFFDRLSSCSTLQSLDLERWSPSHEGETDPIFEALRNLATLRSLRLHRISGSIDGDGGIINFSQLHNLELVFRSNHHMLDFFVSLHVPRLERLLLASKTHNSFGWAAKSRPFADWRPAPLDSLNELIIGGNVGEADVVPIIRLAPNLEIVRVSQPSSLPKIQGLLEATAPRAYKDGHAPKLQTLSFSFGHAFGQREVERFTEALLSFLHTKCRPIKAVGFRAEDLGAYTSLKSGVQQMAMTVDVFDWVPPPIDL